MATTLDLKHLTKEEREIIIAVIKRDEELHENDQIIFDELKSSIDQLQAEVRPGQNVDTLCEICRTTVMKDMRDRFCPRCQKRACSRCIIKPHRNKLSCICIKCEKERRLEEMSGAWVLRYQKQEKRRFSAVRKFSSSKTIEEYQIKRKYDGIHGLSPNEELKTLLEENHHKEKKAKLEETPPEKKQTLTLADLAKQKEESIPNVDETVNKVESNGPEIVVTQAADDGPNAVAFQVVAQVYSFDDFSESTKVRAYEEQLNDDGNNSEIISQSNDSEEEDNSTDIISLCPVHNSNPVINEQTVNDYDIIHTPTPKRKVEGLEKIAIPKLTTWDDDEAHSSYEDIDLNMEPVSLSDNVDTGQGSTSTLKQNGSVSKKPKVYIPANQADDDYFNDNYYSYNSSLDLSLHGSYIDSYYGD